MRLKGHYPKTLGHNKQGWFIFPKPGYYLRGTRAEYGKGIPGAGYRHGGLSLFEVAVPLACLRHREEPVGLRLRPSLRGWAMVGQATQVEVSVTADGALSSPVRLVADTPDLEATTVSDVSATPKTATMRFTPTAPGHHRIILSALLSDQVAETASFDVDVAPAPVPEDEAKTKLKRLFGEI